MHLYAQFWTAGNVPDASVTCSKTRFTGEIFLSFLVLFGFECGQSRWSLTGLS